jgi:hypothetical protein
MEEDKISYNNNDLADLDQEEYYMKTGYDFYDYVTFNI